MLAASRRLLDGRLAAHLLQQLLGDVAQLAHRLDHVHRNADGAGLVGDGAGDGLANPPRRVGAELVAAAILVLVHRPHQAGVAFLDQVEEAQAAIAILLGDGHHQPQVAAGQVALGLLVLGEALADDLDALAETGRLLQRQHHVVVQLLLQVGPVLLGRRGCLPEQSILLFQLVHLRRDLLQLLHQRLDLLRADRQLLDQRDGLAAADAQSAAQLALLARRRCADRGCLAKSS